MNSLVYFYSKFTEEFLLLGAAAVFALLSIYCYHWVIQKRRLGIARSQIPSAVVKGYLNQLIGEAQFVRTQLFGMSETSAHFTGNPSSFSSHSYPSSSPSPSPIAEGSHSISPDLTDRMNALEAQLKDKESLVVNINIEKTKLLEEIERLKKNPGAGASPAAAAAGNQADLLKKIKNLEARLEEYSLFEEDLANLKRLQQENNQLKKKVSDLGVNPDTVINIPASPKDDAFEKQTISAAPAADRSIADAPTKPNNQKAALDPDAVESLLNGTPATPPTTSAASEAPAATASPEAAAVQPTPISAAAAAANAATQTAAATPDAVAASTAAKPAALAAAGTSDEFEKLVDSVENSLDAPKIDPELAAKTDEELLKEFENLLNS